MAIIQDREPNGLRLGSVENLYQESIVQENYLSDFIKAAGVDIRYYKLQTPYPEVFKPILDSNQLSIHAYGEGYVQEWEDPVKMIAYLKFDSDSLALNAYGIVSDSTMTMWLNQTDFAIAMAKKLSQWREYKAVGNSEFILDFESADDLIKNRDNILIDFKTDLFDGTLQAILSDIDLNALVVHNHEPKLEQRITIPCRVLDHGKLKIDTGRINPLLYKGDHYDPFEDDMVEAHLHLEIVSILKDKHGCIKIMGGIRGGVIYHDTTVIGKYIDKVRPEVGDLIDIPVPDRDGKIGIYNQKYEVVHIEETITNETYMNPFLRKYIYQMNLRAYVASGQKEPGEENPAATEKKDNLDLINQAAENAAKKIGLYEDFEDDVYGGYHKINKRTTASVQRDADKSTINNFDHPEKKKGLKKETTPIFVFKDMKMVLSLVSDPKNNNSFLKLSPLRKTTKVKDGVRYIEYLRADDDTLVLVDGTRAYMLLNRFKQMELDESTFCMKPIRLKHEVYGQKNGWANMPFHLVDTDDNNELDMNIQDLLGKDTTPEWKPPSENRLCFPWTNTYLEVEYVKTEDGMEVWTCYAVLEGEPEPKNHWPICAYIKK